MAADEEPQPRRGSLKARLGKLLRSKKSSDTLDSNFSNALTLTPSNDTTTTKGRHRKKITKNRPPEHSIGVTQQDGTVISSALQQHREKYREVNGGIDKSTGESRDNTALLHALVHRPSMDSIREEEANFLDTRPPGEPLIASLPPDIWEIIASYMNPKDAANLAFSSKTLRYKLGSGLWDALNDAENFQHKIDFLIRMDRYLPFHLLCFVCAKYHPRTHPGEEKLKPPTVLNPLFNCPNATDTTRPAPRTRLVPKRNLPFSFVQLATRASRFSPEYGITADSMSRRWKEDDWQHYSRYHVNPSDGHLLMRVTSLTFAPPGLPPSGQRMLLYSREDYTPYFSACAHWRDGELMNLCKCALGHLPQPRGVGGFEGLAHNVHDRMKNQVFDPNKIVTLCSDCRPMRRCPECPTEYLIEVRLAEDKADKSFKQAIVLTRWSDLGDGRSPASVEWAACNGEDVGYDSFQALQKRAISGTFESFYTADHVPGQRIMSLNPKEEHKGEAGNDWY
ncbi:hypothetical protein MBLNU459_g2522t1 [Dothideomycetes sp. NU459]